MIPNFFFALSSDMAQTSSMQEDWSRNFNDPRNLFSIIRGIPPEHYGTDLYVQFPTLVFLLAFVYLAILARHQRIREKEWLIIAVTIGSILGTLTMIYWLDVYNYLPSVFLTTQFTFRLNHFLYLAVAILVFMVVVIELRVRRETPDSKSKVVFRLMVVAVVFSLSQGIVQSALSNQDSPGDRHARSMQYWGNFWYSQNELRIRDGLPQFKLNSEVARPEAFFENSKLSFPVNSLLVAVPTQGPISMLSFCGGKPVGRDDKFLVLRYEEFPTQGCIQSRLTVYTGTGVSLSIIGLFLFAVLLIRGRFPRVHKKNRLYSSPKPKRALK
jgi:hypothetical protein